MGKTALAVEALHRRASNPSVAFFVDLNGLDAIPLTLPDKDLRGDATVKQVAESSATTP